MSVKVTSNFREIAAKKPLQYNLAIRFAIDDIQRTSYPKTPLGDTGNLRDNVTKQVVGTTGRISWNAPYAAAQEAGVTRGHIISNYSTPGTGKNFAENAVNTVNSRIEKHFKSAGAIE